MKYDHAIEVLETRINHIYDFISEWTIPNPKHYEWIDELRQAIKILKESEEK